MPCPSCRAVCTLGWRGWGALAAVNAAGLVVLLWVLAQCAVGALAPHRALALVLAVSGLAPFVWWGVLQLLPAAPLVGDR